MRASSEDFELIATDPHSWLSKADEHFYAAKLIANEFGTMVRHPRPGEVRMPQLATMKSMCLLLALSVENALKALVIASRPEVVRGGRIDRKVLGGGKSGHDLTKLAAKAGLTGRKDQPDLLTRLTTFVQWGGRYPLPLDQEVYRQSVANRALKWQGDLSLVESILSEVADKLKATETSIANRVARRGMGGALGPA